MQAEHDRAERGAGAAIRRSGVGQETLSALRADRNIISAAIYRPDGQLFASHSGRRLGGTPAGSRSSDRVRGERLGTVAPRLQPRRVVQRRRRYALIAASRARPVGGRGHVRRPRDPAQHLAPDRAARGGGPGGVAGEELRRPRAAHRRERRARAAGRHLQRNAQHDPGPRIGSGSRQPALPAADRGTGAARQPADRGAEVDEQGARGVHLFRLARPPRAAPAHRRASPNCWSTSTAPSCPRRRATI